jgi:hypothetical protein
MGQDLVAERHAEVADEDAGAGDQAGVALLFPAKRAAFDRAVHWADYLKGFL